MRRGGVTIARLVGAGKQRAHRGAVGAGRQRLGEIARILDAAVGDPLRPSRQMPNPDFTSALGGTTDMAGPAECLARLRTIHSGLSQAAR
jgi:hypothetical protein